MAMKYSKKRPLDPQEGWKEIKSGEVGKWDNNTMEFGLDTQGNVVSPENAIYLICMNPAHREGKTVLHAELKNPRTGEITSLPLTKHTFGVFLKDENGDGHPDKIGISTAREGYEIDWAIPLHLQKPLP